MDPLSITASILAVLGAGGEVGKACKKIIDLRHAPDALKALNNEVIDLHISVQDVDEIMRQHSEISGTDALPSVISALERIKATLLRLESLIAYELTTPSGSNESRLDRSVWLRAESRVQELKDDIRADRVALASALGLLTSSTSLGAALHAKQLSVSIASLDATVHHTRNVIAADIQSSLLQIGYSNKQNQDSQVAEDGSSRALVHGPEVSQLLATESRTTRITMIRSSYATCGCLDSRQLNFKSPNFLNSILGSLFVGYRASPRSKQTCDNIDCRRDSTTLTYTYVFPQWLLNRVFLAKMVYNSSKGPELCVRVMRVRSVTAKNFQIYSLSLPQSSKYEHAKRLLMNGEASTLDVTPNNMTALRLAVEFRAWNVAELLVRMGADPYYEDAGGQSAFTFAWTLRLAYPQELEDEMMRTCHLLGTHSDFALFGFSELHRAYLGLSGVAFEDVLSSTQRSQIDHVDSMGRTTLSWACHRGDDDAVGRLLFCGADPNKADRMGLTPFHWSNISAASKCMELLLGANADIEVKDGEGQTALSMSAIQYNPDCLRILVAAGADIESKTGTGMTALFYAGYRNRTQIASYLLRSGANINALDSVGNTVLFYAIQENFHGFLELLLTRPDLDVHVVNNHGLNILHYLASYGDEETIQILRSAKLHCFDATKVDESGWMALEIAERRRRSNEEWSQIFLCLPDSDPIRWYNAFKELLDDSERRQHDRIDDSSSDLETISESSTEEVPSEDSDDEAGEDEEVWQDAHQYPETGSLEPRNSE